MPSTKCEGLCYPTHFFKSRGSVIRNNFLEYRTKQATLYARRNYFMLCSLQIKQNIYTNPLICQNMIVNKNPNIPSFFYKCFA